MSLQESIGKWRRAGTRLALAAAVAIGLSATVQPQEAQAHHRWVGPAIAGLIIGAAIAHHHHGHVHYHHKKKYAYGCYGCYPKYKKHRRIVRYGYPGPVYMYGAPYYHGPGIYFGW